MSPTRTTTPVGLLVRELVPLLREVASLPAPETGPPPPLTGERLRDMYRQRIAAGVLDLAVVVPVWERQAGEHESYPTNPHVCQACRMVFPCAFRIGAEAALAVVEETRRDGS